MNVLFVVMEFLPLNIAGVYRPLKCINALKKAGINPIVVTIDIKDNLHKSITQVDESLWEKLHKEVTVIKIPSKSHSSYTNTKLKSVVNVYFNMIGDNFLKAWKNNFYNEIPGIIEKYNPQAIITTCPPFSSAVLARDVSKKFSLPLLLDMRDAWSKLSINPLGSKLHYWVMKNYERSSFEQASIITTVTPQLKDIFCKTHPREQHKIKVIYNSFDFPLHDIKERRAVSILEKKSIHIGYIGTYYYNPEISEHYKKPWWLRGGHKMFQYLPIKEDWSYRSPLYFFKILNEVFKNKPDWQKQIFFHHVGTIPEWLKVMINNAGLSENVILHGYKPYAETLKLIESFDYVLTTSEKVIDSEHYCLPSKLFSYLSSAKPILACVTKGIQADFISKGNLGPVINPDDVETSAQQLISIFENGWNTSPNKVYLETFSTEQTNKDFIKLLLTITGKNKETVKE